MQVKYCDKSSEDDGDEMEELMYDNSNVKGCWSKNKSRIDQDAINTKGPINMERKMCMLKINNSIEKRTLKTSTNIARITNAMPTEKR